VVAPDIEADNGVIHVIDGGDSDGLVSRVRSKRLLRTWAFLATF